MVAEETYFIANLAARFLCSFCRNDVVRACVDSATIRQSTS